MSDDRRPESQKPLLGTAWLESQLTSYSSGQEIPGSPRFPVALPTNSICWHLSDFRKHLQRYRKLDDSITLHLNRRFLVFRSGAEEAGDSANELRSHTECARFWKLLTDSWLNREKLIRSCMDMVDQSVQKQMDTIKELSPQEAADQLSKSNPNVIPTTEDPMRALQRRRALESEVYTTSLKRRMIHDELTVESAIRQQSFQKFRSYCPHSLFAIPPDSPKVEIEPHPAP